MPTIEKYRKDWPSLVASLGEFTRYSPDDRELSGIRRTAKTHTEWLDSVPMQKDLKKGNNRRGGNEENANNGLFNLAAKRIGRKSSVVAAYGNVVADAAHAIRPKSSRDKCLSCSCSMSSRTRPNGNYSNTITPCCAGTASSCGRSGRGLSRPEFFTANGGKISFGQRGRDAKLSRNRYDNAGVYFKTRRREDAHLKNGRSEPQPNSGGGGSSSA